MLPGTFGSCPGHPRTSCRGGKNTKRSMQLPGNHAASVTRTRPRHGVWGEFWSALSSMPLQDTGLWLGAGTSVLKEAAIPSSRRRGPVLVTGIREYGILSTHEAGTGGGCPSGTLLVSLPRGIPGRREGPVILRRREEAMIVRSATRIARSASGQGTGSITRSC